MNFSKAYFPALLLVLQACSEVSDKPDTHESHSTSTKASYCDSVNTGLIAVDSLKGSPKRTAMKTINGTHVHIEYSSPGVRGRIILGGLVPYDQLWVAGAHQATTIRFSRDVQINNELVTKGEYAFFVIPSKGKWTGILNKRTGQHLADEYRQDEDLLRFPLEAAAHTATPRLTYLVEESNSGYGLITLLWDQFHVHVPFKTLP